MINLKQLNQFVETAKNGNSFYEWLNSFEAEAQIGYNTDRGNPVSEWIIDCLGSENLISVSSQLCGAEIRLRTNEKLTIGHGLYSLGSDTIY